MSNQTFAAELFVDVTEEQQQIVAGGTGYKDIFVEKAKSAFKQRLEAVKLNVITAAGPEGATTVKEFDFKKAITDSFASDDVYFPL